MESHIIVQILQLEHLEIYLEFDFILFTISGSQINSILIEIKSVDNSKRAFSIIVALLKPPTLIMGIFVTDLAIFSQLQIIGFRKWFEFSLNYGEQNSLNKNLNTLLSVL